MDALVAELADGAREEMHRVAELGGAVDAVDYMKAALVESQRERWRRIESGEQVVVGMNRFTSTEPSPLTADGGGGILVVDPQVEAEQRAAVERWRAERDQAAAEEALSELARVARDENADIMPATIAAARAGATTGEWAHTLREVFGEYRAPRSGGGGILVVDPQVEAEQRAAVERWRAERDQAAAEEALSELARVARDENADIMPATIAAARAGATTGEWAHTLREVFGEYRAP